jgi:exodeoxyribonuclease V beta subunit
MIPCLKKHLAAHAIGEEHVMPLAQAIRHTLTVPLFPGASESCLKEVPPSARRTELEFCFALNPIELSTLARVFAALGMPAWAARWPERIGRLSFNPTRGFLKGFIDLVCEVAGRYYLIDWKSNWLGPRLQDYHPAAIHREMVSKHYILQYHLYSVALHRHLELRLPGYDFARHFGGIRYLFLRGIDPAAPGYGIFAACPTPEQISVLARTLLASPEINAP